MRDVGAGEEKEGRKERYHRKEEGWEEGKVYGKEEGWEEGKVYGKEEGWEEEKVYGKKGRKKVVPGQVLCLQPSRWYIHDFFSFGWSFMLFLVALRN